MTGVFMKANKYLNEIWDNLKNGLSYYEILDEGLDWIVLWTTPTCIGWRHYGQSANSKKKSELKWIIEVIFRMTPEQFVNKYKAI